MTRSPSKEGPRLHPARARRVLRAIYAAYANQTGLFAFVGRKDAPQTRFLPADIERNSPEHLAWLFFAALTDRRDESENVYAGHRKLWNEARHLYTPLVQMVPYAELKEVLEGARISMPNTSARSWLACARTLYAELKGDPRLLYRSGNIDTIVARKRSDKNRDGALDLPGYGPKLLSLLAVFFVEIGALQEVPRNTFPIDLHVQRLALSTGIVTGRGSAENAALESRLRPLFYRIAREEGMPILELSHALWLLGNRVCNRCSYRRDAAHVCPSYELCGGAPPTRSYFKKGRWDLEAPRYRRGGENGFSLPSSAPLWDILSAEVQ